MKQIMDEDALKILLQELSKPISNEITKLYKEIQFKDIPLVMSPHLWEVGIEYSFEDGSYGQRFIGTISGGANAIDIVLTETINVHNCSIIQEGGFVYIGGGGKNMVPVHFNNGIDPTPCITNLYLSDAMVSPPAGLHFYSVDDNSRMNAPYDIWIRYLKKED